MVARPSRKKRNQCLPRPTRKDPTSYGSKVPALREACLGQFRKSSLRANLFCSLQSGHRRRGDARIGAMPHIERADKISYRKAIGTGLTDLSGNGAVA